MVEIKINTLAVLQARMSSSRLPGKVMKKINGKPMIYYQINRILSSKKIDKLIVATSVDESDDTLSDYLISQEVEVYRGDLFNVLSRFTEIEKLVKPSAIIRLTADCPFTMPHLIDQMIVEFYERKVDYLSNTLELTFPDGLDIEIIKYGVLEKLNCLELTEGEKEHVTLGIINNRNLFSMFNFSNTTDLSHYRWTVDTEEDFSFVSKIFNHFKNNEIIFTFSNLLEFFNKYPEKNLIYMRNQHKSP